MTVNFIIRDQVSIMVDGSNRGPFPKYDAIEAKSNITVWDNACLLSFPGFSETLKPTDTIQVNGYTQPTGTLSQFKETMENIKHICTDHSTFQL
jgi:hypothetical protein